MPELPEVESLKIGLTKFIIGQKIVKVDVLYPKLVCGKGTSRVVNSSSIGIFIAGLEGKKITKIERRAKNLIFHLDDSSLVLIHLKMTGQLVYKSFKKTENLDFQNRVWGGHPIQLSDLELPNKHTGIVFKLEKGNLFYNDVRKFGYLLYFPSLAHLQEQKHFDELGLEPLSSDFSLENFKIELKKQKGFLKKVFLEQKAVVGLGNIYCDEVCFEACVKPNRKIESLKNPEIKKLYEAICRILPRAVELGGSSVSDYLLADGSRGNYAREHKVYNRGEKNCLVCGEKLTKTQLVGRTTVYCEKCQS